MDRQAAIRVPGTGTTGGSGECDCISVILLHIQVL